MTPAEIQALFNAELDRLKTDWFVKMKRQIIMSQSANEMVVFQEWTIGQMAALSAAIKRLLIEAKRGKAHGTNQGRPV